MTTSWLESWMSVRTVVSAHSFVAGPELAPVASVLRVSETPPTSVVTCALTTVVPGVVETSVIVQLPVAPCRRARVHGRERARPRVDREADQRAGRRVDEAGAGVHVDVRREDVGRADRVGRRRRRDLDVRVDEGLDRVARVLPGAVGLDRERRGAVDGERGRGVAGDLAGRRGGEGDRALARGVGVRAGGGAGAGGRGMGRAVRVGQRGRDVLVLRRHEHAVRRCPSTASP